MPEPAPSHPPLADLLASVPVRRLRLRLRARQRFRFHGPLASDLRGALGKALREGPHYTRLFEPELAGGNAPPDLGGGTGSPRPFVLRTTAPPELQAGQGLDVELLSFAVDRSAALAYEEALHRAAEEGFGDVRSSFDVEEAAWSAPRTVLDRAQRRWIELTDGADGAWLRVSTRTPARLLSRGEVRPLFPSWTAGTLLRRLQALSALYGSGVDLRRAPCVEAAAQLEEQPRFSAHSEVARSRRYSYRQERVIPIDGTLGWFEARIPRDLGLLFLAGEVVHVGKATTLGFGELRVTAGMGG